MNLATPLFEEPPRRFRHHTVLVGCLAVFAFLLSVAIWIYVPNTGDGPIFGGLLNGLRDALLILLWGTLGIFAGAATAALAVIPARWYSPIRLALAYAFGAAAVVAVALLLARG